MTSSETSSDSQDLGKETDTHGSTPDATGPIAFMAKNSVAANLFMLALIVGGLMIASLVKQEVFPEFTTDTITVSVPLPGASPEEVEKGVLLVLEEAVEGIDGVKKVTASASEDAGSVTIEVMVGKDPNKVLADVKNAVDRITSFPGEAERPLVSLVNSRREVLDILLYGPAKETVLREWAERLRDHLKLEQEISVVELTNVRARELSIEITQENLRRYGLTLEGVAQTVRQSAVELSGGSIKTEAGEILLRTSERRDLANEFAALPVVTNAEGSYLRLDDIATIHDGFEDIDQAAFYEGQNAIRLKVYRIGSQTPIQISDTAALSLESFRKQLPKGLDVTVWKDSSESYRQRIDLLLRNAAMGLVLVLFVLGLFLELRLAFWVTMGIPISFIGSFLLLPVMDVSFNMISLFAYIITLGMVVDDAIVVGENIFEKRQSGVGYLRAAIDGAREVAGPVTFSILTTVAAFTPLFFVPGFSGKLFRVIPSVVVTVLAISLVESLFVLPAHLGHGHDGQPGLFMRAVLMVQGWFAAGMKWVIDNIYQPVVRLAVEFRYTTVALGLAVLILTAGFVASGALVFTFFPSIESDEVTANLELPFGVSVDETKRIQEQLVKVAQQLVKDKGGDKLCRGISTQLGSTPGFAHSRRTTRQGGHLANVQVSLVPSDQRSISAFEFANEWRRRVGEIPGIESLIFKGSTGPSAGSPVDVQLSHREVKVLQRASEELAELLRKYPGMKNIDDGFSRGKPQLDFKLTPAGVTAGLTAQSVGRQVRSAFFGMEALRQQRGRDELRVMVRFPEDQRQSRLALENLVLRTPRGGEILLSEAVEIKQGFSDTSIERVEGRRVIHVTSDIELGVTTSGNVKEALMAGPLPKLKQRYPGLNFSFEGESRERAETLEALKVGMILALIAIYGLLAIPFGSYIQPAIVMSAIPFGIVGAVIGHYVMGFELSIISMMGIVALTGVVVNDSLVLIDAGNRYNADGMVAKEAIIQAGMRRFRPIWLTSLTTFFGLMPMIFETSLQARFLIPMAISLAFGVLFATVIILIGVPALYMIVEDLRWIYSDELEPERPVVVSEEQPAAESTETAPEPEVSPAPEPAPKRKDRPSRAMPAQAAVD